MKLKISPSTVTYIFLLIAAVSLQSCKKSESGSLSPARNISGTWKTVLTPPTFYYYSDICGTYGRVAKTQIGIKWIVTESSSNKVDIEMYRTSSASVVLMVSQACALYVPLVSPTFLKGEISSSQLTLKDSKGRTVGVFSILTNNLKGDFNSTFDTFCGIYCTGVDTDPLAVVLVK